MTRRTRRALWLIMVAGFTARVATWWFKGGFHYPDEIFQQWEPTRHFTTRNQWNFAGRSVIR